MIDQRPYSSPQFGPVVSALQNVVFASRPVVIAVFALITALMLWLASQLQIDAGFEKQLPVNHPYMQTFLDYQADFGGANRVLIAVRARDGDMFDAKFFNTLDQVTDAVFFLPGVDRARVSSIFTPNVRFVEIVEEGFAGGNVIPADFEPTAEGLAEVRENILKSGQVGRLVSNDFSTAMVTAELLERDPQTGEPLDYIAVAEQLEREIRDAFEDDDIAIHIIGFAKVVGDVADGATSVIGFFGVAFVITALLIYVFARKLSLIAIALTCSLVAVIWQLGALVALGFGIDPLSILLPFLTFAIAVSHGLQMVNGVRSEVFLGATTLEAARNAFGRLCLPGSVALLSDTIGFLTILLIDIPMIQELAITASLGVAMIILTNLILLPVLLSYTRFTERDRQTISQIARSRAGLWRQLSVMATPKAAIPALVVALGLYVWGAYTAQDLAIGDLDSGVPELWPDSRYNRDSAEITDRFDIGVDLLQVIVEAPANGCVDFDIVSRIDDFEWMVRNLPGVQSTLSLPRAMKTVNAGFNEGHPIWHVLPREPLLLVQASRPIETSTGLLNSDCSVMPVLIFTEDHKAETIARITGAIEQYIADNPSESLTFRLATGNVGVMAATNQVVESAQLEILLWLYGALIVLCLLLYRSIAATLCTVLPLSLVSVLCYALMTKLGIGLKVSTLPVAALGAGIGVDYAIYIFSRLQRHLRDGVPLRQAYEMTLQATGSAVLFTGITLAIGVSTWIFSTLKFQADMGALLSFMFLFNMFGAVLLLPALACVIYGIRGRRQTG